MHAPDQEVKRLTGSAQRLLAVLVAAGPGGVSAERIAEEIWGDDQPDPWRPALRMAIARLRKQLPTDWDVLADGGSYRVNPPVDGWVDAWKLDAIASSGTPVDEDELAWMLAGQPYGDIDSLEMVGSSAQHLQMLQIAVAEQFCSQSHRTISTSTCGALTGLLRFHPFNDRLALVVGQTLVASGRRTEALSALRAFTDEYQRELGAPPIDVVDFLTAGVDSSTGVLADPADEAVRSSDPILAKELRHLVDVPLFGRAAELEVLRTSPGVLLTGATGSGKSRLLAAVLAEDPSYETTYVVGDDRLDLPLGPFAVAMPALRDELLSADAVGSGRDEGSSERAASTRAWRVVLTFLEERAKQRPQRLVIDDGHLLDPASLGLLRLLIRSNTAEDLTLIVAGRSDVDDDDWAELLRDGERSGLDRLEVGGLDIAELQHMVFAQFPLATRQARRGLAADVHEASGGLPAVAAPLIATANPATLALPDQLEGSSVLARVTGSYEGDIPEIVGAAAVLGQEFSIGALISLVDRDESSIFQALDELWSGGLIIETDDPDRVCFRHVLIQRAFREDVPVFRRARLHRRAAELTKDAHERANHLASAGTLVAPADAAEALLESANLYAESHNWRKVSRQLRRLDDLAGDFHDAESRTLWALAQDRSGANGTSNRKTAFHLAAAEGDWSAALAAALSGLPQAELPDGDPDRLALLRAIQQDELCLSDQFDCVINLSRQLSLLGEYSEARIQADQALSIASGPDEVALSHVMRWIATRHVEPVAHTIPAEVGEGASPRVLTRIAQVNAINLAECGDFEGARKEAERFTELANEVGDPLRIWHARGLAGMFLLNDGHFDAASELALENFQFAELHDLQQGASTYIGQQVYAYDCLDRLDELGSDLEPFRANLSGILLGRAALILGADASGDTTFGSELRACVEETHQRRGSTFAILTQLFLARFLVEHAPDLVEKTRSALEKFGDDPILAGFGAGSFGPTTRYIAQLATARDERIALLEQSIEAADRHGPLLWRVRTRLDRADLGSRDRLNEAAQLAANTQLAAVVARRLERSG